MFLFLAVSSIDDDLRPSADFQLNDVNSQNSSSDIRSSSDITSSSDIRSSSDIEAAAKVCLVRGTSIIVSMPYMRI